MASSIVPSQAGQGGGVYVGTLGHLCGGRVLRGDRKLGDFVNLSPTAHSQQARRLALMRGAAFGRYPRQAHGDAATQAFFHLSLPFCRGIPTGSS